MADSILIIFYEYGIILNNTKRLLVIYDAQKITWLRQLPKTEVVYLTTIMLWIKLESINFKCLVLFKCNKLDAIRQILQADPKNENAI